MASASALLTRQFEKIIEFYFYGIAIGQVKKPVQLNEKDFLEFSENFYVNNHELIEKYHNALKLSDTDSDHEKLISDIDKEIDTLYDSIKKSEWKKHFIENCNWRNDIEIFLKQNPKKCKYCGIEEEQIMILYKNNSIKTKRWITRGRSLEIDRIDSRKGYENGNMAWCCYWCNNAKADEFEEHEFKEIGEHIRHIWNERLAKFSKEFITPLNETVKN